MKNQPNSKLYSEVIKLSVVNEPVSFGRMDNGSISDLIVPEVFIKDIHFSTPEHMMIMIRVTGPDSNKLKKYFENKEDEIFQISTTLSENDQSISDDFILTDSYIDDGPSLSVDIDSKPETVRVILDFLKK